MKIFWFITFHRKLKKPLRIRLDKADVFIRNHDGTRYLVLFGSEKYDAIYNAIRYFKSEKRGIRYLISHNYARIKIDLYNLLPLDKNTDFE